MITAYLRSRRLRIPFGLLREWYDLSCFLSKFLNLEDGLTRLAAFKKSNALHGRSPRRYIPHSGRWSTWCCRLRSRWSPKLQCVSYGFFSIAPSHPKTSKMLTLSPFRVLYDPTKPVNKRMSVMANTTVARLYHSEAIVLLDGRVMISGSDPTGDYSSPAGSWPEEYRVEVFTPPYLLSGAARPTFTVTSTNWAYGASVSFHSSVGGVKVSLLGSVSSTHGNSMGQRTLFPAVACTGTACTVCVLEYL